MTKNEAFDLNVGDVFYFIKTSRWDNISPRFIFPEEETYLNPKSMDILRKTVDHVEIKDKVTVVYYGPCYGVNIKYAWLTKNQALLGAVRLTKRLNKQKIKNIEKNTEQIVNTVKKLKEKANQ